MKQKLFIISNESIYANNNKFFCDNIDLKSTPESLGKKFEVNILARKSPRKRFHQIKLKKIELFNNIFSYLYAAINAAKYKEAKFLIISISPFTFFTCIFLRIMGKTPLVYLRSDGFGEYKAILGKIGPIIYFFMFWIIGSISKLASCRNYILRGKSGKILNPSQLDTTWLRKPKLIDFKKFILL